ncbi:unnamed protein product [Ambrosiozyma monospora]|uniref:Unnamed protein product n=1 Tax=Ambrosiozyma monospora TaxID=43982 RepID=A0ACB5T847_AMBMO|nr:unnamed protein product [Ambrosiozyma monospora]
MINENTEAIEKDLHRTFPENIHFNNTKDDEESALLGTLRRVLKCFSHYKPKIGYCQSLNFIAGLLLIFMDEEKAFWMLVIITEKYLPGIHDFNLEGVNVHQGVLMLCLRQYLPAVWQIITHDMDLDENDNSFLYDLPPLSFCTTSWFMSVFIGVLPIETTLRVWDVLFFDDSKTIFQISLTVFKIMQPQMTNLIHNKKRHSGGPGGGGGGMGGMGMDEGGSEFLSAELFQIIQNSPKVFINCNHLLTECFRTSAFNKLKQDEILKCQKFVEENRQRYNELIKKRSKVGLNEAERKELIKASLDSNGSDKAKIGLKAMRWNGRLNHRMKKLKRNS